MNKHFLLNFHRLHLVEIKPNQALHIHLRLTLNVNNNRVEEVN